MLGMLLLPGGLMNGLPWTVDEEWHGLMAVMLT